jgi:hypothetical protein
MQLLMIPVIIFYMIYLVATWASPKPVVSGPAVAPISTMIVGSPNRLPTRLSSDLAIVNLTQPAATPQPVVVNQSGQPVVNSFGSGVGVQWFYFFGFAVFTVYQVFSFLRYRRDGSQNFYIRSFKKVVAYGFYLSGRGAGLVGRVRSRLQTLFFMEIKK